MTQAWSYEGSSAQDWWTHPRCSYDLYQTWSVRVPLAKGKEKSDGNGGVGKLTTDTYVSTPVIPSTPAVTTLLNVRKRARQALATYVCSAGIKCPPKDVIVRENGRCTPS